MYYIYRITNKVNGNTYIGQHKYKDLNDNYMGSGIYLKAAKKKYGIENFEKEILYSRIQYKETADDMEKFAIAKERAIGKAEYNIADGGHGGGFKGRNHSDETKRKMSEASKGKPKSLEHRRKMSEANKGKHLSDETRRKISEGNKGENNAMYGKHHSEEARKKMSETRKGRPAHNKGKPMSDEQKKKISEAKKEKHLSEETRRKISEAKKEKHLSDETRRKISEGNKGKKLSEEYRRKISEAHKGKHWYNNGEVSVQAKECPEGFVKGRLHIHH